MSYIITSVKNETIKKILKLKKKKYRDESGLFLVEGEHLVVEALNKGIVKMVITCKDDNYDVEVLQVSEDVMKKLAFTMNPQPIMAICYMKIDKKVDYHKKRYILLDHLQDPGNMGTILRTSLALGYHDILISKDSVDFYNDKVIRATQGALFSLNISIVDLADEIKKMQERGIKVYGTALEDALSIEEVESEAKMAFILGNEGNGMSKEILDMVDERLYIPIDSIESLNVAIASSIIMYKFRCE